jgi:hypothetical protein
LPKLGLGLVAKFSIVAKGFRTGSVCYICVVGRPFLYCLRTEVHFYTMKAAQNTSIRTYFVCKMFHDGIIMKNVFSKSCCVLELCYIHLHCLRVWSTLLVARLVRALRYKPESSRDCSPMVSMEFFIDRILPPALWTWG